MSVHYCMQNPCPVCHAGTTVGAPAVWRPTFSSRGMTSTLTLVHQAAYFTWREALLQALDAADRSEGKPRVHQVGTGWVVTYRYRPQLMNAG